MKTELKRFQARMVCAVALGMGSSFSLAAVTEDSADTGKTSIPWSQLGAKAGADYQGDGLAVTATHEGARLRCVFQRLEGEATREGLWLTSTVTNGVNDRFRVTATTVGRVTPCAPPGFGLRQSSGAFGLSAAPKRQGTAAIQNAMAPKQALACTGAVQVADKLVRFTRPGLVEEYTVSMDGVRQDFIIEHPPLNPQLSTLNQRPGDLVLRLAVSGAQVKPSAGGARLVLEKSGRKIACSRLRVTDATGKVLSARIEVASGILPDVEGAHPAARVLDADYKATDRETDVAASRQSAAVSNSKVGRALPSRRYAPMLVVVVNDTDAVYPVRIDPTFSDANWISMGGIPGANRLVYAAVVDGSGNLYIGGEFILVGDVVANRIAKWNGSNWSALGSGLDYGVAALAVSGSNVYAGGWFTKAGGSAADAIAKWDGSSWSAVGSGLDRSGEVRALAVSGSNVYAGGHFTSAGGIAVNAIAKWDGSSWSAVGSGMDFLSSVNALAVSGNDVYAGGSFSTAGGISARSIAKWDGSSWSALGSGMGGGNPFTDVNALAVSGSDLYAGGSFSTAGGIAANYIAKWDGSNWSTLGSGLDYVVRALAVSGSNVFAGGSFTTAGGSAANYIATWNGSNWSALGSGMGGATDFYTSVRALVVSGSDVYAGGDFTSAGGSVANTIAKWDGSNWSALSSGMGLGMNSDVYALTVSGSDVYAGGYFTTAGGNAANGIAKWNGNSWSALGSGIGGHYDYVSALAVSGSDVFAGGRFMTAGGSAANYIAKWNGSSWSALGSGMNNTLNALAVSGNDVYAGGWFTTAGGNAANYIAKWDGTNWSALGSGMNSNVYALATSGSDVYAGGAFTTAGVSAANFIAKWNGSSWSALGSGMNSKVYALVASGSDVYAGGEFTTVDGMAANYIAKWNGSSWSALGSGLAGGYVGPKVYALAMSGNDLYAGGDFTTAGGSAATNVAKWNESNWSALGSGIGRTSYPFVSALAVSGSDLYAGGYFTAAGGKVSADIARAYLLTLPALSVLRSGTDVMVSWPSADTAGFALEQAGMLAPAASWVTNAASVTDDGANKSVTVPATNSPQFFRLRRL